MSIGLIVGSGMEFLSPSDSWREAFTPYGPASVASAVLGEITVVLLRRHGPALNIPPHLVNYRANLWALREAGVDRVLATAAVGSLTREVVPGSLAVIDDFIDFTKRRESTFFDRPGEAVTHIDFSVPYCPEISSALEQGAADARIPLARRVTYLCVDGPRYETPAEIRMFGAWGVDVVGMTGVPEVVLARELGICYGALAVVTNFAAGIEQHPLSHLDVLASISERRQQIQDLLTRAAAGISDSHTCYKRP